MFAIEESNIHNESGHGSLLVLDVRPSLPGESGSDPVRLPRVTGWRPSGDADTARVANAFVTNKFVAMVRCRPAFH
ncbi:hypothetical protein ACWD4N_47570, partial [Streptomyces sp. NPDC002586]